MKHAKILAIAAFALLFASCNKESVTPIEESTIFNLGDGSKYAYNGRTGNYVFHDGDRIQVGGHAYALTYISPSQASVERCPQVTPNNTIFPAEYVTGMCGGLPQFTVPETMRFSKYGTWDGNLYCPQRARGQNGNHVSLCPIFPIADYNVTLTRAYCEAQGVTGLIIDSLVLISAYPCVGIAHLNSGGTAVFRSVCNRLVLRPHNEESATACLDREEAILGYAYCPGFATMTVHWHSEHITGCKTVPYNRNMVAANNGNMDRLTININL